MKHYPYYIHWGNYWIIAPMFGRMKGKSKDEVLMVWGTPTKEDAEPLNQYQVLTFVGNYPDCEIYNDKYRRLSDPQLKTLLKQAKAHPKGIIEWRKEHGYDKSTGWQQWH